ncbi:hypothetical protein ABVT39_016779 [Epinephelus coioides]
MNSQNATALDCLSVDNGVNSDRVRVSAVDELNGPGSVIVTNLRYSGSTSYCFVKVEFKEGSNLTLIMEIYNFGRLSPLKMSANQDFSPTNFTITTTVNGSVAGNWTFTGKQVSDIVFLETSGCRHLGTPVQANSAVVIPDTCTNVLCDTTAVPKPSSTCHGREVCHGNNTCAIPKLVCTVTGSTVIDFFNKEYSIPDRCPYTIIKSEQSSRFELLAVFRERRRKDVAFLDHLILTMTPPGVPVFFEQGGRVRFGDQPVILNATTQVIHGVELSKDHTGVTAKIQSTSITIFFDGNTAHVRGLETERVVGLCGNLNNPNITTSLNAEKTTNFSRAGCDVQHSDTNDTSINCSRSSDHCELMRRAPFTACHNTIDPRPYVDACTNVLCQYPEVDGLRCQFFEAYAKSCSLKKAITLQNWRSMVGCSASPRPCQDKYCSDNEFCGQKPGGTRCFCRALFASKYKPTNTFGEPTVCMQNSASLSLANCLLEDKGIDYTSLHLNDPTCEGDFDSTSHMVTFHFNDNSDSCGTEVSKNMNNQIIYKNTIKTRNTSNDIITRHDQVQIDFSCLHKKPEIKSVTFKIKDSSVIEELVYGVWNYTLMMRAYTDPEHIHRIRPTTEIQLNQRVWLELKTEGLDSNMVALVTDSCWATSQPLANDTLRYNLIINGCGNDSTVEVEGNGMGTSNSFSFNVFQFTGHSGDIYLHCEVKLCLKQEEDCTVACGSKRRRRSLRSKFAGGNSALISMSWNN